MKIHLIIPIIILILIFETCGDDDSGGVHLEDCPTSTCTLEENQNTTVPMSDWEE